LRPAVEAHLAAELPPAPPPATEPEVGAWRQVEPQPNDAGEPAEQDRGPWADWDWEDSDTPAAAGGKELQGTQMEVDNQAEEEDQAGEEDQEEEEEEEDEEQEEEEEEAEAVDAEAAAEVDMEQVVEDEDRDEEAEAEQEEVDQETLPPPVETVLKGLATNLDLQS